MLFIKYKLNIYSIIYCRHNADNFFLKSTNKCSSSFIILLRLQRLKQVDKRLFANSMIYQNVFAGDFRRIAVNSVKAQIKAMSTRLNQ